MVQRACECCGTTINVKAADVARGWGRFCSKRCKALNQGARGTKSRPVKQVQAKTKVEEPDSSYEENFARRFPLLEIGPGRSYANRWKGFEEWDAIAAEEDRKEANKVT